MKTFNKVIRVALLLAAFPLYSAQVVGDRMDLNQLAVTAGLERKYGTYMLDIPSAFTAYDLKRALAKREHIPIKKMKIIIARQTLEDTDRIQEVIRLVPDNKIYLRLTDHPYPSLKRPIDRVRYSNRWNQL